MAKAKEPTDNAVTKAWRKFALGYPEAWETGACVNRAFKAGKKSFLFMGINDEVYHARIRLGDSVKEAEKLAKKNPDNYDVGKFGWTKVTFPRNKKPPKGLLERWIDESYRILAPKKLLADLPEKGPPKAKRKR